MMPLKMATPIAARKPRVRKAVKNLRIGKFPIHTYCKLSHVTGVDASAGVRLHFSYVGLSSFCAIVKMGFKPRSKNNTFRFSHATNHIVGFVDQSWLLSLLCALALLIHKS